MEEARWEGRCERSWRTGEEAGGVQGGRTSECLRCSLGEGDESSSHGIDAELILFPFWLLMISSVGWERRGTSIMCSSYGGRRGGGGGCVWHQV